MLPYSLTLNRTQLICRPTDSFCIAQKKTQPYSHTLQCTQNTCQPTVSHCSEQNTRAALQSQTALHTTHTSTYSITQYCTQNTLCLRVSQCTAHKSVCRPTVSISITHKIQSYQLSQSALQTKHRPNYNLIFLCTKHTRRPNVSVYKE